MGADKDTLATLDAQVRLPDRDLLGNVALFPLAGSAGVSAIYRQRADGQEIATSGNHLSRYILDKGGCEWRDNRRQLNFACDRLRNGYLVEPFKRGIHGSKVLLHHRLAPFAIALANGLFDLGHRLVAR